MGDHGCALCGSTQGTQSRKGRNRPEGELHFSISAVSEKLMSRRLMRGVLPLCCDRFGKVWGGNDEYNQTLLNILSLAQEGASFVSECLDAAARINPGDAESWHDEWY